MKSEKYEIGDVVKSTLGRDSGHLFVVTGFGAENYVTIADGMFHKIGAPKKKNVRHLSPAGSTLPVIAEKLRTGKKIFDNELSKAIKSLTDGGENTKKRE